MAVLVNVLWQCYVSIWEIVEAGQVREFVHLVYNWGEQQKEWHGTIDCILSFKWPVFSLAIKAGDGGGGFFGEKEKEFYVVGKKYFGGTSHTSIYN